MISSLALYIFEWCFSASQLDGKHHYQKIKRSMSTSYTILLTSNEPWSPVWFSKQHVAHELSLLGHEVYFLNAPTQWKWQQLGQVNLRLTPIQKGLIVVDYTNPFPLRLNKKWALYWNDKLVGRALKKVLPKEKPILWWQFDPFRLVHLPAFPNSQRIYHVVDPYQHIWTDTLLAQQADLIVLVSSLYEQYYKKFGKKLLYIPHGISEQERNLRPAKLEAIEKEWGKDYLLFVGTLNPDVDLALLQALATQCSQQLLLIGPNKLRPAQQAAFEELIANNNVAYLGVQKATDLKEYVALAAVGLVPYQQKKQENVHRTPLKLLNYLAQATPIVTTLNYELQQLNEVSIYTAASTEEFISTVQALLKGEKTVDKAAAQQYGDSVLYPVLLQKILAHV